MEPPMMIQCWEKVLVDAWTMRSLKTPVAVVAVLALAPVAVIVEALGSAAASVVATNCSWVGRDSNGTGKVNNNH